MRNPTLHELLHAFTNDAAMRLSLATADGDEIPFEVVESEPARIRARDRGRVPLYCYRPLTGAFIRSHLGLLVGLPTYAPAARALESCAGLSAYLRARAEARVPDGSRERADAALRCFLARVFAERSEFGFDDERFKRAYEELERSLYDGCSFVEVVAELRGIVLDAGTQELTLAEGLSLARPESLTDPPPETEWDRAGAHEREPGPLVLLVQRTAAEAAEAAEEQDLAPVRRARGRFRRVVTALRLFDRGACAIGHVGFTRVDGGPWAPVAIGAGGRSAPPIRIDAGSEDELRAFCNLISRRLPPPAPDDSGAGEVPWALGRYELGCERQRALEALSDHLLALRALLEPEGPASGRLAQRLAVICAPVGERAALAERTAHAIALERAVIAGLAPAAAPATALVEELSEHLRAILRDVLCGHLDDGLCHLADELLAAAAASVPASV